MREDIITREAEPQITTLNLALVASQAVQHVRVSPFRVMCFPPATADWELGFGDSQERIAVKGGACIVLPNAVEKFTFRHTGGASPETLQVVFCNDPGFRILGVEAW